MWILSKSTYSIKEKQRNLSQFYFRSSQTLVLFVNYTHIYLQMLVCWPTAMYYTVNNYRYALVKMIYEQPELKVLKNSVYSSLRRVKTSEMNTWWICYISCGNVKVAMYEKKKNPTKWLIQGIMELWPKFRQVYMNHLWFVLLSALLISGCEERTCQVTCWGKMWAVK